jgi:hypothetical protein
VYGAVRCGEVRCGAVRCGAVRDTMRDWASRSEWYLRVGWADCWAAGRLGGWAGVEDGWGTAKVRLCVSSCV